MTKDIVPEAKKRSLKPTTVVPPQSNKEFLPRLARLVELTGPEIGKTFAVDGEIDIGRDIGCRVQISSAQASRRHARIFKNANGEFVLEDLGSRNGTLLNGHSIDRAPLKFGDKIQLAVDTILMFTYYDRLEEQLLQSQKMESIGRLASGIAHDFNNLLTAMINNLDFLQNAPPTLCLGDQEIHSCLKETKAASERAAALTQQLLDFARAHPNEGEHEPVLIDRLAKEVASFLHSTSKPAVEIDFQIEPGLVVLGNASRLHRALMNLCINAKDAMPEGGRLTIGARLADFDSHVSSGLPFLASKETIVITVADTGIGMDEETRTRAFEPFFTTKNTGEGTGLGLSIVYGIIRNHNGRIDVESKPREGTTFKVYLPSFQQAASTRRKTLTPGAKEWLVVPKSKLPLEPLDEFDDTKPVTEPVPIPSVAKRIPPKK
ncbi:MAG: ATP-binding protein [Pseudomonadota bacterium]